MSRLLLALAVCSLAGAVPAAAQEVTVSVAISMKEAIEDIGRRFSAGQPGLALRYNFGASGELQKQIEGGAPVDVFVSAAQRQVDELDRAGLLLAGTRVVFARNVLVALKPRDGVLDVPGPSDLLDRRVQRIAIGSPKTVPAGQYAEESLRALGLWDRLKHKLVHGENVRQVLDYVVRGEVDIGVVYATDGALRLDHVRLAFAFSEDTHRPIVYPAAVVAATRQPVLAKAFVEFLTGREAQAVLGRLGFEPAPAGAR
ncbi:MAG TPA: molybdate ABC transporter substrate-binding protein [Methylomirabilota bacterium]|nr:molybdate ABC transporter substrate-binding protein [Methylomirabilota bacterium]